MNGQNQPVNRNVPPRPAVVRPPAQMQTMTPKEIMGILRRHILLIIILTVAGAATGTGAWFALRTLHPLYTAKAAIEVLPPETVDPMTIGEGRTNKDFYDQFRNSQVARIQSPGMLQMLLERDEVRNTRWFKKFVGGSGTDIPKAVRDLEKHLKISAPRDQQFITLSMTCGSPKEARAIVNEMMKLFLSQKKAEATSDFSGQLAEFRKQRDKARTDLDATKRRMDAIRKGSPYGDLNEKSFRDYLSETLADQETDLANLQNETIRLASLVQIFKRRAEGNFDDVVAEQMEQDPVARNMISSIAALEPALAELSTRFGENHRRVKEVRDALEQRRQDLKDRKAFIADVTRKANAQNANDQLIAAASEFEAQQKKLETVRQQHRDMMAIRAGYTEEKIVRDEKQTLLEEMNTHVAKLVTLIDDPEISKVKRGWEATEPLEMSSPQLVLYLPGGFILGLLAGLGLAFAIELLNDLVRSPSDVMKHLRVPLLGMIYHSDEDDDVKGIEAAHVVRQAPYSIMSECYRQFRTNLKLRGGDDARNVLLVTSGNPDDGKTSVAVNLASTLVAENRKVLLIDANFRRPMTATLFPASYNDGAPDGNGDYGLSNYLMGQCEMGGGIIRSSGVSDLDIIDSGPLPGSPAEVLASGRMHELLEKARQLYDYVIIDGPPLLVSDAKTLAAHADGTILVLNAETTHRGAAQRTLRELSAINANLVGTVLVGVKAMKGGYFQEVFKSYQDYRRVPAAQPVAS